MKLGYPLTKLLNPCPFCGNNDNFEWEYHEGWSLPFKLSCSVCGATTSNWESKEECLDYWNKRYQPSLQLSEESRKFLKELYHEIVTQDNRGTANPYFVVKTTRKIQGFHPDYSNNLEYMDMSGNGDYESYPTKEEAIQALIKDYEYSSSEAEVYIHPLIPLEIFAL